MAIQKNRNDFGEYQDFLKNLGGDNSAAKSRLVRNLRRAIMEELTEKERQAVGFYYVREMKMTDIADLLGVNQSTVSRSLKRARIKLRRCLRYGAKELLEDYMEDDDGQG